MRLPSLRTVLFLQAGIILFVPLFILAWQLGLRPGFWYFLLILAGNFSQQWLERRVKAQLDECALQTLRAVEAGCFQSAGIVILLAAACLVAGFAFCKYMPTILTAALFLIYLERAALFTYWDKKGLR